MRARLRRSWFLLGIAAVAVLVLAFFTFRRSAGDAVVDCRGDLVFDGWGGGRSDAGLPPAPGFRIAWGEARKGYAGVRVVREVDGILACSDLAIPAKRGPAGQPPWRYEVRADGARHVVLDEYGNTVLTFHFDERTGRRFVAAKLLSPAHLPSAAALIALGALLVGLLRARRAAAYATRMFAWTEAELRPDGLLEAPGGGTTLGTVDRNARVPAGTVLVDGARLAGHDVYRGLPIVTRGHIAAGSHERWASGTVTRIRDAQALAILAMLVAAAAFAARLLA